MSQLETCKNERHVEIIDSESIDVEEIPPNEEDVLGDLRECQQKCDDYKKKLIERYEINYELNEQIGDLKWYKRYVDENVTDFEQWKADAIRRDEEAALERERIYQIYGTNDESDIENMDRNMEKIRAIMRSRREKRNMEEE